MSLDSVDTPKGLLFFHCELVRFKFLLLAFLHFLVFGFGKRQLVELVNLNDDMLTCRSDFWTTPVFVIIVIDIDARYRRFSERMRRRTDGNNFAPYPRSYVNGR